jgi:phenylacetyl-CoA:acceptor oxidoreductase
MTHTAAHTVRVPTYCYQCVAGPDLLTVKVEDGVATEVEPNFCAADVHPGGGKVCVKAYGLVQKTYNPNRVLTPMKRSNPKKGRDEDPGFVPVSWDEALATIAAKLNEVRAQGLVDGAGYPRVAASFGGGGTPQSYMGTFPAFLGAWGPIDMGFGSGQGVKCYHSEHLYGEFWHRAFIVAADTPLCNYLISCGSNIEASGGVVGVWRHAKARVRGMKRVQVEPHLSVTGACSAEWVPIKPKTDAAFLFALIHVLLHEAPRDKLDLAFLGARTASPYLVGAHGYYLRERASRKPLVWDSALASARVHDSGGSAEALEGCFEVDAVEIGPDNEAPPRSPAWSSTCARIRPSGRKRSATCRPPGSAGSPMNSWPTPASARRSTSTARRCRSGRSPSRWARRSTTAGAATSAAGRAPCWPRWSAGSKSPAARSARRCV